MTTHRASVEPAQNVPHAEIAQGVIVSVPIKTVAGLNAREHWRTRQRRVKHERQSVAWALTCAQLPTLPVTILMTRLSPGTLDSDNLQGACKAVRDAVADALGVSDNHPLIKWRYGQEKCPRGQFGVRIVIAPDLSR